MYYPSAPGQAGPYPPMAGQPGPYPPMAGQPGPYPPMAGQPGPYPPMAGQPGPYPPMAGQPGPYPPIAGQPGYPQQQPPGPPQSVGPQVTAPVGNAPQTNVLVTPVELTVSAKNLLDRDTFSKSDPVCVLYIKEPRTNEWIELGRTEQIKNNLNPAWNKKFLVDYRFEERQLLKFSIYDWDGNAYSLNAHDYLGCVECSLGEIVAAPNKKFERNLILPPQFGGKTSTLVVIAEELGSNKEVVHVKLNGRKLDKKDFLGKSDPFVVLSKKMDDGSWTQAHKTEVIKNNLNPDWRRFTLRAASLTGGNPERRLRIQVFDWDNDGSSDLIGEFEITYMELLNASKENRASFPLINPNKKAKKKSYKNSGILNVESMRVEEEKTFLDYIQNGVQLHFTVAIDFTASNGDPNHPQSLHYRNPSFDNQYSLAIKAVGEIIQDYDTDKLFPAMGFGAKVPPMNTISHEFFLNGNPENPFCQGVQGILDAYHHSLNTVQLYGPTYFAPVINHVARFASTYQDGQNYFVLLIITDGIICDLDATKESIINASHLPMSIIIIGVGQEDFSAMEFLDSDGKLLRHNGRSATRDIVQFVELQRFVSQYSNNSQNETKHTLAKEVLAEIPGQVCQLLGSQPASQKSREEGTPTRPVLTTAL